MHFSALRSLTQPCMTAYCIWHITYDPGISPGSANQCILGDVYLRSNLSRKVTISSCFHCGTLTLDWYFDPSRSLQAGVCHDAYPTRLQSRDFVSQGLHKHKTLKHQQTYHDCAEAAGCSWWFGQFLLILPWVVHPEHVRKETHLQQMVPTSAVIVIFGWTAMFNNHSTC